LRLINRRLPEQFPFHPHGKFDACHMAFLDHLATLDHINPLAGGGNDEESIWVTTSMTRNLVKSHRSLAELGWTLHPGGINREGTSIHGCPIPDLTLPLRPFNGDLAGSLTVAEIDTTMAYVENEKAPATRKAYAADWLDFTFWCQSRGASPLPARGSLRSPS
jgi:hypothetical protein